MTECLRLLDGDSVVVDSRLFVADRFKARINKSADDFVRSCCCCCFPHLNNGGIFRKLSLLSADEDLNVTLDADGLRVCRSRNSYQRGSSSIFASSNGNCTIPMNSSDSSKLAL